MGSCNCTLKDTVVWEKFTVGIIHVKKFHVKIFSPSWVKYSHIYSMVKIFHVL